MPNGWSGKLEKVTPYRWRIPKSYKKGMRVDGIVYVDEELMKDVNAEQALEQVANVAFLPGIQKASYAMPDIHWGYGFPIGGVAAMDAEKGVISPGGVGYDISCIAGQTPVLTNFGYTRPIEDFEKNFKSEKLKCVSLGEKATDAKIALFMKRKVSSIIKVRTKSGKEILATEDHPFYTPNGMKELSEICEGDQVALYPFEGVPYREPPDITVASEKNILSLPLKKNLEQTIKELKDRGLLPLSMQNTKFPILLKLMGFILGDGTLYFTGNKGTIWFYGKPEDLETIRQDIFELGFTPSKIYSRRRKHCITTTYDKIEFERTEYAFKTTASSLAALLWAMGMPAGNRAAQDYDLPDWLFNCPLWQKRLFLAALFGAELSSPSTITGRKFNFYTPILSLNKKREFVASGEQLLYDISELLLDLGVESSQIKSRKEHFGVDGHTSHRLRLQIASNTGNLIRFWSAVGFEYNREKSHLANLAAHYLKLKQQVVEVREKVSTTARRLKLAGVGAKAIFEQVRSDHINWRFVERSVYGGRKTAPRVSFELPSFEEFAEVATQGLGRCGLVWDEMDKVEEVPFNDYVYDFTVLHKDHNFIANNFIVSNCGVRLLKTNMLYEEVKDYFESLMYELARNIPKGVGSRGKIKTNHQDMQELLATGVKWAVKKGYGWQEDLEFTEEKGSMAGADPSKVSQRAFERGFQQPGTLGAGNHFIELQEVVEIFDGKVAQVFGLFKGQFVVMVHSGSRGLGHQVCTDYLRDMERATDACGIELPDRQLACAPINSDTGKNYLGAMAAAINYALTNRHCLAHWARVSFENVFKKSAEALGMHLLYDVSHNTAKFEEHEVDGKKMRVCVHRKGATRAFPPGHPDVLEVYRAVGQPVIIPGDMGRASYILVGTETGTREAFASTCHGAGRVMSRAKAKKIKRGFEVKEELAQRGIMVIAGSIKLLAEEASYAYKDVSQVVDVCHQAGLSKKVAKVRPLGVIKG